MERQCQLFYNDFMKNQKSSGVDKKASSRIGVNLRKARENSGMSQEDLAVKAELVTQTVSNIENGRSIPRQDTLSKLAETLGVTTDVLINGKSDDEAWNDVLGSEFEKGMAQLSEEDRNEVKNFAMFMVNYKLNNRKK